MLVYTDGWRIEVGGSDQRTGHLGKEVVRKCKAWREECPWTVVPVPPQCEFVVPHAVLNEPLPRHSIIAALKRQPEWKAWEKKRLAGKV